MATSSTPAPCAFALCRTTAVSSMESCSTSDSDRTRWEACRKFASVPVDWNGFGYAPIAKVGVGRYFSPSVGEVELHEDKQGRLLFACCPCSASRLRPTGIGTGVLVLVCCKCEGAVMDGPGGSLSCSRFTIFEELPLEVDGYQTQLFLNPSKGSMKPSLSSTVPRPIDASWNGIGYKLVAKVGSRYFSIFAGVDVEYELGRTLEDEALPTRMTGLFFCLWPCMAVRQYIPPGCGGLFSAPRALLRCKCEGPIVQHREGRLACSRLTPLQQLPLPSCYTDIGSRRRRPALPRAGRTCGAGMRPSSAGLMGRAGPAPQALSLHVAVGRRSCSRLHQAVDAGRCLYDVGVWPIEY